MKQAHGTIHEPCENTGKPVTVEPFASLESMGYKTDYTAVPCQHLVIRVAGKTSWAKRYSGARLPQAAQRFEKAVADLRRYVTFASEGA